MYVSVMWLTGLIGCGDVKNVEGTEGKLIKRIREEQLSFLEHNYVS